MLTGGNFWDGFLIGAAVGALIVASVLTGGAALKFAAGAMKKIGLGKGKVGIGAGKGFGFGGGGFALSGIGGGGGLALVGGGTVVGVGISKGVAIGVGAVALGAGLILMSKGRPGNNQVQNEQFREVMRRLGYTKKDWQWRFSHDNLPKPHNMGFRELLGS